MKRLILAGLFLALLVTGCTRKASLPIGIFDSGTGSETVTRI